MSSEWKLDRCMSDEVPGSDDVVKADCQVKTDDDGVYVEPHLIRSDSSAAGRDTHPLPPVAVDHPHLDFLTGRICVEDTPVQPSGRPYVSRHFILVIGS